MMKWGRLPRDERGPNGVVLQLECLGIRCRHISISTQLLHLPVVSLIEQKKNYLDGCTSANTRLWWGEETGAKYGEHLGQPGGSDAGPSCCEANRWATLPPLNEGRDERNRVGGGGLWELETNGGGRGLTHLVCVGHWISEKECRGLVPEPPL